MRVLKRYVQRELNIDPYKRFFQATSLWAFFKATRNYFYLTGVVEDTEGWPQRVPALFRDQWWGHLGIKKDFPRCYLCGIIFGHPLTSVREPMSPRRDIHSSVEDLRMLASIAHTYFDKYGAARKPEWSNNVLNSLFWMLTEAKRRYIFRQARDCFRPSARG